MAKQTVLLFLRALIIGVVLNFGIQQISKIPPSAPETAVMYDLDVAPDHDNR